MRMSHPMHIVGMERLEASGVGYSESPVFKLHPTPEVIC